MNISFDLDSTLIPNGNEFETEKRSRIAKFIGIEKIRKGTPKLISELQKKGHNIHIYTTSYRKKRQIRRTLKYYGIRVKKVVNQTENQKVLKERNIYSSKFPTAFGFDIHIDDLKGVGMESEKLNFRAIIIEPSDDKWIEKVVSEIENYENKYFMVHFERMKMMQSYLRKNSKENVLYLPEYNASKRINSIFENNRILSVEHQKIIETELSNVKNTEHYGGSLWYDYVLHTNSILKYRMK